MSIFSKSEHLLKNAFTQALLFGTLMTSGIALAQQTAAPAAKGISALEDKPDIHALLKDFSRTSLGDELLTMCEQYNVTFAYDKNLYTQGRAGIYSSLCNMIKISPQDSREEQINSLAHEIRHALMRNVFNLHKVEKSFLSPRQMFVLRQYMEADAFAYAAYFCADRAIELDLPIDKDSKYLNQRMTSLLYQQFDTADGLTLQEYRMLALLPTLASLSAYEQDHKDIVADAFEAIPDHMRRIKAGQKGGDAKFVTGLYLDMLRAAPDDANFEKVLRQMGGLDFDPASPTALSDAVVTSDLLLKFYPMLSTQNAKDAEGKKPEIEKFLDKYQKTYLAALDVLTPLLKPAISENKISTANSVTMKR